MVSSEKESELMAHIEESFGQYYHERARMPLPPAAAAMWMSPARRRGKGMFSLDADAPRPPCAEGYLPVEFFPQKDYNNIVRDNLVRLGFLADRDAEPAVVSAALSRWYFSKPNRQFGISCTGGGDQLVVNPAMLEALRTEQPPAAEGEGAGPSPRTRTTMLRYGLLAGSVLVLGGIGYAIWRRSR